MKLLLYCIYDGNDQYIIPSLSIILYHFIIESTNKNFRIVFVLFVHFRTRVKMRVCLCVSLNNKNCLIIVVIVVLVVVVMVFDGHVCLRVCVFVFYFPKFILFRKKQHTMMIIIQTTKIQGPFDFYQFTV